MCKIKPFGEFPVDITRNLQKLMYKHFVEEMAWRDRMFRQFKLGEKQCQ